MREGVKHTEDYIEEVAPAIASVNKRTIIEAMYFRAKNKNKKFSMADCISYFMAKNLGIKFLTGDKEFEGLENVEFVK